MRRPVSIACLIVWLVLLGVEVLEHTGFFVFSDQNVDSAVDAALTGFGAAVRSSQDEQTSALASAASSPGVCSSLLDGVRPIWPRPVSAEAIPFRRAVAVYKLHAHFRI